MTNLNHVWHRASCQAYDVRLELRPSGLRFGLELRISVNPHESLTSLNQICVQAGKGQ